MLHGDGAAVTQQLGSGSKSCLFVSFRSLLANQSTYFDGCALDKLLHQNTVRQHWSQSFQSVGQLFPVLARQNGFTREEHGAIVVKRTCTRVKSWWSLVWKAEVCNKAWYVSSSATMWRCPRWTTLGDWGEKWCKFFIFISCPTV